MDPYLERHWLAVHTQLVASASAALNQVLPEDLVARPEERLGIESGDPTEPTHEVAPDVRVFEPGFSPAQGGGPLLAAPFKLVVNLDPITERYVKIIRPDDERLVTVIEFISPSNKSGRGLDRYTLKREEFLEANVHVVEIDLTRRGDWRALLRPHLCPKEAVAAYRATIRLGGRREAAYLYPMSVQLALPAVPIPLRPRDPEIKLDLQSLLEEAYATGRHSRTIDYAKPCDSPLDADDAAWAGEMLRTAGGR
jgi:hypothetical protein